MSLSNVYEYILAMESNQYAPQILQVTGKYRKQILDIVATVCKQLKITKYKTFGDQDLLKDLNKNSSAKMTYLYLAELDPLEDKDLDEDEGADLLLDICDRLEELCETKVNLPKGWYVDVSTDEGYISVMLVVEFE